MLLVIPQGGNTNLFLQGRVFAAILRRAHDNLPGSYLPQVFCTDEQGGLCVRVSIHRKWREGV